MSEDQKRSLEENLLHFRQLGMVWFHHGDCVGADAEAHEIAARLGYKIAIHPPYDPSRRAFKQGDYLSPVDSYLSRNRKIVLNTSALFAAPHTMNENARGGTWYTVRFAKELGRPLYLLARIVKLELAHDGGQMSIEK